MFAPQIWEWNKMIIMKKSQKGAGMIEVLVALLLLAIAVLGFSFLQVRAVAASHEASRNVQAMNIARDLSERIRVNRTGLLFYKSATISADCSTTVCNVQQMAEYDFKSVSDKANNLGMNVAILDCQGSSLKRKCIYVAWEGTNATNGAGSPNCTNGTAYVPNSKCLIVEVYNYV